MQRIFAKKSKDCANKLSNIGALATMDRRSSIADVAASFRTHRVIQIVDYTDVEDAQPLLWSRKQFLVALCDVFDTAQPVDTLMESVAAVPVIENAARVDDALLALYASHADEVAIASSSGRGVPLVISFEELYSQIAQETANGGATFDSGARADSSRLALQNSLAVAVPKTDDNLIIEDETRIQVCLRATHTQLPRMLPWPGALASRAWAFNFPDLGLLPSVGSGPARSNTLREPDDASAWGPGSHQGRPQAAYADSVPAQHLAPAADGAAVGHFRLDRDSRAPAPRV
jgi:hypothetical protein